MRENKIIYFILGAFIGGVFLLIYIQFNSSKNINALISANEKMVGEFNVSKRLNELEKNILTIESKVRGIVTTKDTGYVEGLETNISEVRSNIDKLQNISDDDTSAYLIDKLDTFVEQKILFNRQILDSFRIAGKASAEILIATNNGKRITDSIIQYTQRVDILRKKYLASTTASIDKSGRRAQQFSSTLIVVVLLSAAGLFWYIINIISKQIFLIQQLNISEKKVKDSAELKEKFMANMSHEIRTPMNAIIGFTNLLQRKNIDSESKEYVKTIQRSGESLLNIINDILDLSKIEAGMMRIETAPFDIRGLVHSIETMFKAKAVEKQLELHVVIDKSLPPTLEGDATRLTQILVNIIGNALKFTNKGGVTISITNEEATDEIIKMGITIIDTGIGIEKSKLDTIFERFQQAEDSVTRRYGGTGLGLSIVKDLVSLQDGSIEVSSEPTKGTTFKIIIPYKFSTEADPSNESLTAGNLIPYNFENVCVLVAEDNEINQSLIHHLFKNWQLKYNLVTNGRQAIEMLQTKSYNLILMDIQMPEMDGYTATQEIRMHLKIDTPIIAMTAHALAGEKEKCISYGMNDYIPKPIKEALLHRLIVQFINITAPEVFAPTPLPIQDCTYQFINLHYLREVSNGDADYEKTVTELFIEAIPVDLGAMANAWDNKRIDQVSQLAHNLKTTISVMGLNDRLAPLLDTLEYEKLNDELFAKTFKTLQLICTAAAKEAGHFYSTIS